MPRRRTATWKRARPPGRLCLFPEFRRLAANPPQTGRAADQTSENSRRACMIFELRQYRLRPGQRERWVKWMEEKIIPYQVALGVVVIGSFVAEEDPDLYVWMRRF